MKMNTTSPHDKLPILEEGWRCEDNTVSILKRNEKPTSCSRFLEVVKLIFYLELIFFIGWIGCIFLSQNLGNTNHNDAKTEISHACGPSSIDCSPTDTNNQIDHKHRVIRDKRSSDEDEVKRQSCISNMNATRDKISQLTEQFIPGDDSDLNTIILRDSCRSQIVSLTLRVMMDKLISRTFPSHPTDEQWRAFALDIKERIINSTGEEHRQKVESSGSPTSEIVTDLRTAIESMIHNYRNCERIVQVGNDGPSTDPTFGDLLNEREKCERITDSLKEDARPLIVQIIPGDASDPYIVQLREKVENITLLMTSQLLVLAGLIVDSKPTWNLDTISDRVGNLTDEKWRKFIDSIRDDVVNSSSSAQREQLETSGPITQEMINDIRTGVFNYLSKVRNCVELTTLINHLRGEVEAIGGRTKRDSIASSEHRLLSDYLKNGEFNMVKLLALRNIDPEKGGTF